ncbi:CIC11C00000000233 [Sungouiella intermedia]|uniref:ATPase inhibitor, mitochondrial n=1 Tax=Sungouiella intermedia TaxID=45354 RepID=A0A1L0G4L4_9ASCO|nr:CIC11C00000000233 [[Candida] intermedia]SGZ51517.1 CIC11C00000001032 [[Candida] intermedia]
MLKQLATKRIAGVRAFSVSRAVAVDQPSKTDAFKDRENAQENVYIKKHEAEQLKQLKERLAEQKKAVDQLEKDIKDLKQ